jgi:hypothetical protein
VIFAAALKPGKLQRSLIVEGVFMPSTLNGKIRRVKLSKERCPARSNAL